MRARRLNLHAVLGVTLASVLAGCQSEPAPPVRVVAGIVSAGQGRPVAGARVGLRNVRGNDIPGHSDVTGDNGSFAILLTGAWAEPGFQVVVEGGMLSGGPLEGQLRADVREAEPQAGPLYVTPITTVAAEWLSRHPQESLATSLRSAKAALGIPDHVDPAYAARWTERYLSPDLMLAAANEVGGISAWTVQVVDRYEAGSSTTYPGADTAANGGTATGIAIAWSLVAAQAASCTPAGSPVPGLGSIGVMLSDSGLVGKNPSCNFAGISEQIAEISSKLDALAGQVGAVANMVDEVRKEEKDAQFITLWTDYSHYTVAVKAVQDSEHLLAATVETFLKVCPFTNPDGSSRKSTIADLADAQLGASRVAGKKDYRCSEGALASTKWKTLQLLSQKMFDLMKDSWETAPIHFMDGLSGGDLGVRYSLPYRYWQVVRGEFISRAQVEQYVDFVDRMGGVIALRAIQRTEQTRRMLYGIDTMDDATASEVISLTVSQDFPAFGQGVLDGIKPPVRMPEQLAYAATANLPALSTQAPRGPILDLVNKKAWVAACLDGWNPSTSNGMGTPPVVGSPDSCPTRGIVQWARGYSQPSGHSQWFQNRAPRPGYDWPTTIQFASWYPPTWSRSETSTVSIQDVAFVRPSDADLATLAARARTAGQAGAASIDSWLEAQGLGVFDGLTKRKVAMASLFAPCIAIYYPAVPMTTYSCGPKNSADENYGLLMGFQDPGAGTSVLDGPFQRQGRNNFAAWVGGGLRSSTQLWSEQVATLDRHEGSGTFQDGVWFPEDVPRSVALLVGDVPDIQNYVPFYGK